MSIARVVREYEFTESGVREWCDQAEDDNPLHLDDNIGKGSSLFDERVVPGFMLLDRVSGLVTQWGEAVGVTPVLTEVDNVSFDEPVHFGQEIVISIQDVDAPGIGSDFQMLGFVVTNSDESDVLASGQVVVYLT